MPDQAERLVGRRFAEASVGGACVGGADLAEAKARGARIRGPFTATRPHTGRSSRDPHGTFVVAWSSALRLTNSPPSLAGVYLDALSAAAVRAAARRACRRRARLLQRRSSYRPWGRDLAPDAAPDCPGRLRPDARRLPDQVDAPVRQGRLCAPRRRG